MPRISEATAKEIWEIQTLVTQYLNSHDLADVAALNDRLDATIGIHVRVAHEAESAVDRMIQQYCGNTQPNQAAE